MVVRTNGGVFNEQTLTGSLSHWVICGADFSGAVDSFGQPVPFSAAEIIFNNIEDSATVNIMNPNSQNLSFALEENRSDWDAASLTAMVQGLGTDVGTDHVNCSVCTVQNVPYIWGCGAEPESFLDLTDTPKSYTGAANYVVTVNSSATGLIFTPAAGVADYISVPPGTALSFSSRYFVNASGTVTLPQATGSGRPAGTSIIVTKPNSASIFINTTGVSDIISTDLGNTNSIEVDATQEVIFVFDGTSTWNLQIGSVN